MKKIVQRFGVIILMIANYAALSQTVSTTWQEYLSQGLYAKAIDILSVDLDTSNTEHLTKLAHCHAKLGHIPQAKKFYKLAHKINASALDVNLQLAYLSEKEGNWSNALLYYKHLNTLDSTNPYYYKEIAKVLVRQRKEEEGIKYLLKALKIDSLDIDGIADVANLYLNDAKEEQADPFIKKGIALDSNSIRMRQLRARFNYRIGNFDRVRHDLTFTLAQGDSTVLFQRLLGTAYYYLDSIPQAVKTFQRLLDKGEDVEFVRAGLGYAQLKMNNEMIEHHGFANLREAIHLGTSERIPDYRIAQAEMFDKWGQTQSAFKEFKAIYDTFQRPKTLLKMAEIQDRRLNDKELSLIYYQEYVRVCSIQKKPHADCKAIASAVERIKFLNPQSKSSIPQNMVASIVKDSSVVVKDTLKVEGNE